MIKQKKKFDNLDFLLWKKKNRIDKKLKVFACSNGYPDIKKALKKRGWVENMDGVTSQFFDLQFSLKSSDTDFRNAGSNQILNHFFRSTSLTTKNGLLHSIKQLPWLENVEPDCFFPRSYDLGDINERDAFEFDFKRTKAEGILRTFLDRVSARICHSFLNIPQSSPLPSSIPIPIIKAALTITERSRIDINETIDDPNDEEIPTHAWNIISRVDSAEPSKTLPTYDRVVAQAQRQLEARLNKIKERKLKKKTRKFTIALDAMKADGREILKSDILAVGRSCGLKPKKSNLEKTNMRQMNNRKAMLQASLKDPSIGKLWIESFLQSKSNINFKALSNVPSPLNFDLSLMQLSKEELELAIRSFEVISDLESSTSQSTKFINGSRSLWIAKPSGLSRGRGIRVVSDLDEIKATFYSADCQWLVQKYIESPLLVSDRKFDIRQWVMVMSWDPLDVWFYDDSYLRLSVDQYDMDCTANLFSHLTNNSIVKHCSGFYLSEIEGCMISSQKFANLLDIQRDETQHRVSLLSQLFSATHSSIDNASPHDEKVMQDEVKSRNSFFIENCIKRWASVNAPIESELGSTEASRRVLFSPCSVINSSLAAESAESKIEITAFENQEKIISDINQDEVAIVDEDKEEQIFDCSKAEKIADDTYAFHDDDGDDLIDKEVEECDPIDNDDKTFDNDDNDDEQDEDDDNDDDEYEDEILQSDQEDDFFEEADNCKVQDAKYIPVISQIQRKSSSLLSLSVDDIFTTIFSSDLIRLIPSVQDSASTAITTTENKQSVWKDKVQPAIKRAVLLSLAAAIGGERAVESRPNTFELYGYDFMIDSSVLSPSQPAQKTKDETSSPSEVLSSPVWLVEINSSPAMDYSTPITEILVKNVLEDCIKVVVDRGFNSGKNYNILLRKKKQIMKLLKQQKQQDHQFDATTNNMQSTVNSVSISVLLNEIKELLPHLTTESEMINFLLQMDTKLGQFEKLDPGEILNGIDFNFGSQAKKALSFIDNSSTIDNNSHDGRGDVHRLSGGLSLVGKAIEANHQHQRKSVNRPAHNIRHDNAKNTSGVDLSNNVSDAAVLTQSSFSSKRKTRHLDNDCKGKSQENIPSISDESSPFQGIQRTKILRPLPKFFLNEKVLSNNEKIDSFNINVPVEDPYAPCQVEMSTSKIGIPVDNASNEVVVFKNKFDLNSQQLPSIQQLQHDNNSKNKSTSIGTSSKKTMKEPSKTSSSHFSLPPVNDSISSMAQTSRSSNFSNSRTVLKPIKPICPQVPNSVLEYASTPLNSNDELQYAFNGRSSASAASSTHSNASRRFREKRRQNSSTLQPNKKVPFGTPLPTAVVCPLLLLQPIISVGEHKKK